MNSASAALLLTLPPAVPLATAAACAAMSLRAGRHERTGPAAASVPPPADASRDPREAVTAGVLQHAGTAPAATTAATAGSAGHTGAAAPTVTAEPAAPARAGGASRSGLAGPPAPGTTPRTERPRRTGSAGLTGLAGLVSPAAILGAAGVLAASVPDGGPVGAYGRLLRADAMTVWMLLVVGAVAALALAASPAYIAAERAAGRADDRTALRYYALVHAFLGAMCLAVLAANLGVLWVAIEATTIVTAFLVGHRRTRASVEAAWKYVVICSAGIALAFLGTVLIYYAARQAGLSEASALDWPTLAANADRLDPAVTRLGTALVVLGFGAKAGLVPLHAWLPDAHSQAPAPVSALMSGVLLAVSFTALLRYKVIADEALGTGYTRSLLVGAGLLTLALSAALLLGQRDYKRMLAYSSMEHMSLIALGSAIGTPLAMSAVLLHIAGHGLAKTVAFCSSGHILQLTGTTRIGRVRGLLARSPALGAACGLAVVALLGLPPFSLFASEVGIVRAGFAGGLGWAVSVALVLLLVAFAALAYRTGRMLLGPEPSGRPQTGLSWAAGLPLAAGLLACAALGTALGPLADLLSTAASITGGHRP